MPVVFNFLKFPRSFVVFLLSSRKHVKKAHTMSLFSARVIKNARKCAAQNKEDNYDLGVSCFVSILAEFLCNGER